MLLNQPLFPIFPFPDYQLFRTSIPHTLDISDKYIIQRESWPNDGTLQHIMGSVVREQNELANQHFEKISHEISHIK